MAIKNLTHAKRVSSVFKHLKLKSVFLLISGLYASSVMALQPFVIKDIRVEGVQRTEAGFQLEQ